MAEPLIDPEALKRYSFSVWSYKQGEIVSLMIHIGDRLGLYRALQRRGSGDRGRARRSAPGSRNAGCSNGCAVRPPRDCSTITTPTASS